MSLIYISIKQTPLRLHQTNIHKINYILVLTHPEY